MAILVYLFFQGIESSSILVVDLVNICRSTRFVHSVLFSYIHVTSAMAMQVLTTLVIFKPKNIVHDCRSWQLHSVFWVHHFQSPHVSLVFIMGGFAILFLVNLNFMLSKVGQFSLTLTTFQVFPPTSPICLLCLTIGNNSVRTKLNRVAIL